MRFLQRSLTARLLTLFLLLAIVPLFAIGFLAYDSGRQSTISNVEAHLESVVILKEQEIENWVEHVEHSITWLAGSPQTAGSAAILATHTVGGPEYLAAHDALVAEFRRTAALGHLSPVLLVDGNSGQIVASSDTSWEGQFRETETWFVQGKTSPYVSDILHSLTLGRPTIVVAAPVTGGDGQLLGVLAGHADLEELNDIMLERSGLGKTGETYLINEGNLLLTDLRFDPGAVFKKWIFTEGANRALEGKSGVGLYLGYREEPVIGAYGWLEDRDMALLAEIDQAEAFAPIVTLRNSLLGIGTGVAAAVIVLGIIFARTIIGPVHQLVVGAEKIGRGNLDYRIEVKARDEIGRLADAFNEMAANLNRSLGETDYRQRLLLALGEAAQAVQRARTPDEIYRIIGDRVTDLGYHVLLLALTDDRAHMALAYHTFESRLLQTAEKLMGILARDFCVPIDPTGHHHQILFEGQTIFFRQMFEPLGKSLSKVTHGLVRQLIAVLGIERGIYAPLIVSGKAYGILIVTGTDLTEADVPAVTAFANQAGIALENALLYREAQIHAENLEQRVAERTRDLEDARIAALNMMEDADEARRRAEDAEVALKRQAQELARSNSELEQFAYVASHDLQEPLRKVRAFGDRLKTTQAGAFDERGLDYLERMQNAADRMQRMIEDLLVLSRVTTRAEPFVSIDLDQVAREAISDLEIRIEQTGGRVEIGSLAGAGQASLPTIEADPSQMQRLLENLISNALKFHREGIPPVVKVTGELIDEGEGRLCRILVEDNGIGFDAKYLDRIFQPFERLHGRDKYSGTGIGLAICRKITERHGGSITAQSAPGEGATFIVTLPIKQPRRGNTLYPG